VEKDLKAKDREAAAREEALTESLEHLQTALRRHETCSAAKELRLRQVFIVVLVYLFIFNVFYYKIICLYFFFNVF
jgi:hypothetical protein